ncbi:MAG: PQQ-binding-like beta-propeller repeat protein, partial [Planctomycetes bacterium]|nr:PQQ-binding-like beta-propeller repeat protein [Planctomycetota bacterium]
PDYGAVVSRRWMLGLRNGGFQLLHDRRRPRAAQRPWLLVRDLNEQELQLRNAARALELRVTSAATIGAAMPGIVDDDTSARFAFGGFDHVEADALTTWPVVIYGYKAVVPVRGGLVCVGLGPERGGGARLWEYEIAQPFDISNDFSDRAVGGPHGFYFAYRDDRIVCLDFASGKPRWERDFVDLRVERLYVSGDQLVVVGQNREIVVLDGQYGDDLRVTPVEIRTPERVTVMGDTIVLATGRALVGLSAETLEPRWNRSCASTVTGWFALPERNWLAYRELAADKWTVIDAATGREQFEADIPVSDEVTAAAVVGGQLLVAGLGVRKNAERNAAIVSLFAIDIESGRVVWGRASGNILPINTT